MKMNVRAQVNETFRQNIVVIDAELDREDHSLIPQLRWGEGWNQLDVRTDLQTRFNQWWKKKI
jgi:hypothetical protein